MAKRITRRSILKTGAAALAAPMIVPSSVFGQNAPSNRIAIGAIGVGHISRIHDMHETFKYDTAQIVAVCDLDSRRVCVRTAFRGRGLYAEIRPALYRHQRGAGPQDLDAVIISTPGHQYSILAVHAVRAGKDVYMQKPALF